MISKFNLEDYCTFPECGCVLKDPDSLTECPRERKIPTKPRPAFFKKRESEPDTSDIPAAGEEWFAKATLKLPTDPGGGGD